MSLGPAPMRIDRATLTVSMCFLACIIDKQHKNRHKTGTKTHNHTSGGEIKTIQTGLKILTPCIHLGGPFAGPGSREPAAPRPWVCKQHPSMDTGCRIYYPVSIVYVCIYHVIEIYISIHLVYHLLRKFG